MDDIRQIDANGKVRSCKHSVELSPCDAILAPEPYFTRVEVAELIVVGAGLILGGVGPTAATP